MVKNKHHTEEAKGKMSLAHLGKPGYWTGKKRPGMTGNKHHNWKEDSNYGTRHDWIAYHYGKANKCGNANCIYPRVDSHGRILLEPKRFVWSNITGEYKRVRSDWQMLCQSCHIRYDKKYIPGAAVRFGIKRRSETKIVI